MIVRSLFVVLAVFSASAACADSDPAKSPCAECHGVDGVAIKSGIPHLNGQLLDYLELSIAQFKAGRRPGSAFGHAPAGIDDAAVAEVLKQYSTAKAVRPKQDKVDPELVARGAALYQDRCMDCHPDNGRESDKDAPLVAAQDLEYIIKQGRHFVDGKRKYALMMEKSFQGLSDADLAALAHFFASQEQLAQKLKKRRR